MASRRELQNELSRVTAELAVVAARNQRSSYKRRQLAKRRDTLLRRLCPGCRTA